MTVRFLIQIFWFRLLHRVWDESTRKKWETLLSRQAKEYRRRSIWLGGLLIKFGQFLSTRADIMPDAFIKELKGLVDRVEPMPFSYSKHIIEEEWGNDLSTFIEKIDENPVASASIGEVYKATLKGGKKVAVKVQRYRVQEIFHMDFKALRIVFWMLSRFTAYGEKADLKALHTELVSVMSRELDFTQELKHANYFSQRFADFSSVHVPEYYEELCTYRVLVMEWVEGTKINQLPDTDDEKINRKKIARTLFDLYMEQFLNPGKFHADPHVGNIIVQENGSIGIIDFGMVGEIKKEDTIHLKKMIQGFILDDYDRVLNELEKMDILLAGANKEKIKKMLRKTVEMYSEGEMNRFDADTMEQIMEDIQLFVKDQPIQLPADYAFFGRAASIILGVIMEAYPDIDLAKWGKPAVKQWISGENLTSSIYKEVLKDTAKPLLSLPRALIDWLKDGDKEREWQKDKQQRFLMHQFYMFYAVLSFFFVVGGLAAGLYGYFYQNHLLTIVGWNVVGVFFFFMFVLFIQHFRMMRKLRKNRRL